MITNIRPTLATKYIRTTSYISSPRNLHSGLDTLVIIPNCYSNPSALYSKWLSPCIHFQRSTHRPTDDARKMALLLHYADKHVIVLRTINLRPKQILIGNRM